MVARCPGPDCICIECSAKRRELWRMGFSHDQIRYAWTIDEVAAAVVMFSLAFCALILILCYVRHRP